MLFSVLILYRHGFAEVPEGGRVIEVQYPRGIVGYHEGQHGVLHQVVVGAAAESVQPHQVLPVRDAAVTPLSHGVV